MAAANVSLANGTAPEVAAPLRRNEVVERLGTPDETLGSVNEPRLRTEHGFVFNEKWVYQRPRHDPSRPRERIIYWLRYDFVGAVRVEQDGHVVKESPAELRAHE